METLSNGEVNTFINADECLLLLGKPRLSDCASKAWKVKHIFIRMPLSGVWESCWDV